MKTKSIDELIESCLQFLKETGYNKEVTIAHKRRFILVKNFMGENSIPLYSEAMGENFKLSFLESNSSSDYRYTGIKSSINLLNDVLNNVPIRRKRINRKIHQFPGEIGKHIILFLQEYKEKERIGDKTFFKHSRNLSYFAIRLHHDKIGLHNLNELVIRQFTSSHKSSTSRVCVSLRRFLNYLYEAKLTDVDLSILLN